MKKSKIKTDAPDSEIIMLKIDYRFAQSADPEYFGVTEFYGDIFGYSLDFGAPQLVGKLHAYKFNRGQIGDITDPLDFDGATADFMPMFDGDGTELTGAVLDAAQTDGIFTDFLILNRLEILPEFRGKNHSAEIFEIIGTGIGFNTVTALKSFPLQLENCGDRRENGDDRDASQNKGFFGAEWQKQMQLDRLPANEKNAQRRLSNYYKKFGFRKVKNLGGDFLVRSY